MLLNDKNNDTKNRCILIEGFLCTGNDFKTKLTIQMTSFKFVVVYFEFHLFGN